jgi:hypothetical protein
MAWDDNVHNCTPAFGCDGVLWTCSLGCPCTSILLPSSLEYRHEPLVPGSITL